MLLTFGIVSIVAPVLSLAIQIPGSMSGHGFAICGWPFVIVGLVLGILAWTMGSGDLKRIRAGAIDRSAEGGTKAGYITGIIGTLLSISYILCNCLLFILVMAGVLTILGFAGYAVTHPQQMPRRHNRRVDDLSR